MCQQSRLATPTRTDKEDWVAVVLNIAKFVDLPLFWWLISGHGMDLLDALGARDWDKHESTVCDL
jgi:hypothetical protein